MSRLLLIPGLLLFTACASQGPIASDSEIIIGRQEATPELIRELLDCPFGTKPACIERMGQPVRCYCADEDTLRQILEPNKYP